MGTVSAFQMEKSSADWTGDGCSTMWTHLISLNYTFKNGQGSKMLCSVYYTI